MSIIKKFKRLFTNSNGQVAVIVALLIVSVVGMTALVVDVGSLYEDRRTLQGVADAAALAGAQELPDTVAAEAKAITNISRNYDFTKISVDIAFDYFKGVKDTMIVVTVKNPDSPIRFGAVYGSSSANVSASATAVMGSPDGYNVAPWGLIEAPPEEPYEFGKPYTLKYGAPPEPSPGNFGALALDGNGAPPYEAAIIWGSETLVNIGDWVGTLTGNKTGPTGDGVEDRIALLEDGIWTDEDVLVDDDFSLKTWDTQYIIVPIISFWPNGSSEDTQIVDLVSFVISSYSGQGGQALVSGIFLDEALIYTNGGIGGVDETGIRIIRLIK